MRYYYFLPVLCFFAAWFLACKNDTPAPQSAAVPAAATQQQPALPADFQTFYQQFHTDSVFQMSHIHFPLQGDELVKKDSATLQRETKWWKREEWVMQHADFDPKDYTVETRNIGDIIIIEQIMAKAVPYGIERRFGKQTDGSWALIYYSDMQERKR